MRYPLKIVGLMFGFFSVALSGGSGGAQIAINNANPPLVFGDPEGEGIAPTEGAVQLGYFSITDAEIVAAVGVVDLGLIASSFVPFGDTISFGSFGATSAFQAEVAAPISLASSFVDKEIALVAYTGSVLGNASSLIVVGFDTLFQADNPVFGLSLSVSDEIEAGRATIVVGSLDDVDVRDLGGGLIAVLPGIRAVPIPEPGAAATGLFAAVLLAMRRRR